MKSTLTTIVAAQTKTVQAAPRSLGVIIGFRALTLSTTRLQTTVFSHERDLSIDWHNHSSVNCRYQAWLTKDSHVGSKA